MNRVFNFSAGPAALPEAVLRQAQAEMLDWNGQGASVMELSHRGKPFIAVAEQAEQDLRDLMAIPDDYRVLFFQGGATTQFSMLPMNLLPAGRTGDYLITGAWGKKAWSEAKLLGNTHVVASSADSNFSQVPERDTWQLTDKAAYFHYTPNETIGGVEIFEPPALGDVPIMADMSSTILSRPIDVSAFGMIYAGAQKNIGPAGISIVIIRDELVAASASGIPSMLSYAVQAKKESMFNTPPTFAWYLSGLVFKWLKAQGGLSVIGERNKAKAELLYAAIDGSGFYSNNIAPACRSQMNVPFLLADSALDGEFVQQATEAGLHALKGHRSVGGMRASIYNAMDITGVKALIEFMADFERRNG